MHLFGGEIVQMGPSHVKGLLFEGTFSKDARLFDLLFGKAVPFLNPKIPIHMAL